MTDEEKNAIERLWSSITDVMFCCLYSKEECDEDKRIVLDLIKKQQAELEKKDKMIDLMGKYIESKQLMLDKNLKVLRDKVIKQYFEKQVEME